MSNIESQSNQPLEPPSSEPEEDSPDAKLDQPIGETSDAGLKSENVGIPVEGESGKATDIDEL